MLNADFQAVKNLLEQQISDGLHPGAQLCVEIAGTVVADFAVEHILPRLVGFERAFEMVVRGVRLSGTEARDWGLAARCVLGSVMPF